METDRALPRELTRHERATIRRLIVGMCANYDGEHCCLPLDYGRCYMLDKWWTGCYCKYFEKAVLPLNPILESTLTGQSYLSRKACPVCSNVFLPVTSQTYCSERCRDEGNRRRSRERMRKKRQKSRV